MCLAMKTQNVHTGEFHCFCGVHDVVGMMTAPPRHDDRKGHHYYTTPSQADSHVYSSDDPCGHHASQKYETHPVHTLALVKTTSVGLLLLSASTPICPWL